tara:strand:+ start:467 stop:697 length:231 start_codon:yes stop_codon:yes gene_type:complete
MIEKIEKKSAKKSQHLYAQAEKTRGVEMDQTDFCDHESVEDINGKMICSDCGKVWHEKNTFMFYLLAKGWKNHEQV